MRGRDENSFYPNGRNFTNPTRAAVSSRSGGPHPDGLIAKKPASSYKMCPGTVRVSKCRVLAKLREELGELLGFDLPSVVTPR